MNYIDFLRNKMAVSHETGFDVSPDELTTSLYPHVKDTVRWAVKGGCRAIFSSFGMQKTVTQLEILRVITNREGGKALIVCPKRVVVEFVSQAKKHLDMEISYVRNMQEVKSCPTNIMVTNYERVRDGEDGVRIDPNYFITTSLDEASVLRSFGTKTYQEFLPLFSNVKYRFVATATPSPNRYKELIHYSAYLGVMDSGQALTRFFKRDSTKANNLTLYPNKEHEFWTWVSTWALFLTKPSDLGYPDVGYELPELRVHEEIVNIDNSTAGKERDGQFKMFRTSPHPDSYGQQNWNAKGKQYIQSRQRLETLCCKTSWTDFPTQSPICGRDDGLSLGLVNITFPKWRAESVKALGNAIVPQVIYEIFKAIEDYGNRKNKSL